MTPHSAKFQNKWYNIMPLEEAWVRHLLPFHTLHFQQQKWGTAPKSGPVLFTLITLKSDSWFRSTGDFCGRLYRSGVLMSSRGAVANGVVSGVRSKRPRWDYHSQGEVRKVLPARALRVRATHFRGQGKLSNEQPGLSFLFFKDYTILHYHNTAAMKANVMRKSRHTPTPVDSILCY